ncbi:ANKRD17, partial [Symbiodinium microadriaticum]
AGGLVNDMYAMLALNFIFPPLMFLMDYEFAMNFFFRRRLTEEKVQELNRELDQYRDKE